MPEKNDIVTDVCKRCVIGGVSVFEWDERGRKSCEGGTVSPIYLFKPPSSQSRVYRVTQLRTDGVHCRESAGKGSVSLKVVPNGCCASLSHTHCRHEVGVLKVPA